MIYIDTSSPTYGSSRILQFRLLTSVYVKLFPTRCFPKSHEVGGVHKNCDNRWEDGSWAQLILYLLVTFFPL